MVKTTEEIKAELNALARLSITLNKNVPEDLKLWKKLQRQAKFLKPCLQISIKMDPNEEFLLKELDKIKKKNDRVQEEAAVHASKSGMPSYSKPYRTMVTEYVKSSGQSARNAQVKRITYLLNKTEDKD